MAVKSALRLIIAEENLRRAKERKAELTQQEIAEGSKISQSVISTLINNKSSRIDFVTIDKLCAYFNVEPGELFIRE